MRPAGHCLALFLVGSFVTGFRVIPSVTPPVSSPRVLGDGNLSVAEAHDGPAGFDSEGGFYFTRADASFSTSRIYRVPWSARATASPSLAPFSTGPYDAGATFSPDGNVLLFTSQRVTDDPEISDGWNLWWKSSSLPEAVLLPAPVSSGSSECCAVFSPDGSFLFSSNRAGSWDVYRARESGLSFEVASLEGTINTEHDEWPSYVAPGERFILFSSTRPGGLGGDDIYVACPDDERSDRDRFLSHHLSAPVNSAAYEDSAVLHPAGDVLLWSSRRPARGGRKFPLSPTSTRLL